MEYLKLDPRRNLKPRAKFLGWPMMRIFELLLDVSATYDLRGRIPVEYLDTRWLATQWGLSDEVAIQMQTKNSSDLVSSWLNGLVQLNNELADPIISVEDDGSIHILGWDEFYSPKGSSTDRVRKHRAAKEPSEKDEGAEALMKLWNDEADPALSRVKHLSHNRLKMAKARASERTPDEWKKLIHKINSIPGLLGKAGGNWRADFDWFLHPMSIAKLEEGKYDNWGKGGTASVAAKLVVTNGEDIYD